MNSEHSHGLLPFIEAATSPTTNFLAAFGFGLVGTLYFALFGADLNQREFFIRR
jgi:hypothetical protein